MLKAIAAAIADLTLFKALSAWWSGVATIAFLAFILVVAVLTR